MEQSTASPSRRARAPALLRVGVAFSVLLAHVYRRNSSKISLPVIEMAYRPAVAAGASIENWGMKERLTTIWSLHRRGEMTVRIYYRVRQAGRCRVLCLKRVTVFKPWI